MGPKKEKAQQPKKKKRHQIGTTLPADVEEVCQAVLAKRGEDEASELVARDVEKIRAAQRVEEQTTVVGSWGIGVFGRSAIDEKCVDANSVWYDVLRLLVSFLFHHQLAHLQKAAIGVLATTAKERTVAQARLLFRDLCKKWVQSHWDSLCDTAGTEIQTSVDSRAALTRRALLVVCDVDCLLDHPKPVFTPAISSSFPLLMRIMTHCTSIAVAEATGNVPMQQADDGGMTYGMEDLKYFTRITLYLLQKYKEETRAAVADARCSGEDGAVNVLSDCCQRILRSEVFPKESLSTAGLIAAILLRSAFPADVQAATASRWLGRCLVLDETPAGPLEGRELANAFLQSDANPMNCLFKHLSMFSRLVLLRGIANCGDEEVYLCKHPDGTCLLFDVIVPFAEPLCTSSDPSLRFLALQTLELAVRKVKDCLRQEMGALKAWTESEPRGVPPSFLVRYDQTLQAVLLRVLDVLWLVWDEPTAAIGHLLTDVFELIVETHKEAQALERSVADEAALQAVGVQPSQGSMDLHAISSRLLDAHWLRRGKYPSLTVLLPVVGVHSFRKHCPQIVQRILEVMHSKALAHGAGALFAAYAAALATEISHDEWNEEVLRPTAEALLRPGTETVSTLRRHHIANYALQPLMTANASVTERMLDFLSQEAIARYDQKSMDTGLGLRLVAAHVYIIKLAKAKPNALIEAAVTSSSPTTRINAVQLLSLGHKPSDLPTLNEIRVLKTFTVRNLKTDDSAFRSQHCELLRKWLVRCKESLHRYYKDLLDHRRRKRVEDMDASLPVRCKATEDYLVWLAQFLVRSSYSTSPLERRCVAMELLQHLIANFSNTNQSGKPTSSCKHVSTSIYTPEAVKVYERVVQHCQPPTFVSVLMGSLSESWDKVRLATWELLRLVPSPLPGYSGIEEVQRLANKAAAEMRSCKIKDADSGALIFRLLHRKYAVQLGWTVALSGTGDAIVVPTPGAIKMSEWSRHYAVLISLLTRLHRLKSEQKSGEFSPTHGILAAVKNILADINLKTMVETDKVSGLMTLHNDVSRDKWQTLITELLSAVQAICSNAMRNVAGATTGDVDEFSPLGVDCRGHAFFADRHDEQGDRLVVVNSWLAVKEGCGLIAEIITTAPLSEPESNTEILPVQNISEAGDFLVSMALQSKHNGAIAKACDALHSVCFRTIRCRLPSLFSLPSKWMQNLLNEGGVQSQKASRILRRSAGLPHILCAVLDAEDHSAGPPALANSAVTFLLEIIEGSELPETDDTPPYLHKVNALNVLKYIVEDTKLRDVVLVHSGRCLLLTLNGFNHEVWAVRNSSLILYSALMNRVVGGSRTTAGSTSFKDFLMRYQNALPTLLGHLQKATQSGQDKELHPCLYPLLLLFSLLAPSSDVEATGAHKAYFEQGFQDCSPALLVLSLVDRCHNLKNCMGRMMAARALLPLISTTALPSAVYHVCLHLDHGSCLPNNMVHGRLLQVEQFLQASAELEAEEKKAVHEACKEGLKKVKWIQRSAWEESTKYRIAPVNGALTWKICKILLGNSVDEEFAVLCKDHAFGVAANSASLHIGADELRHCAATVYIAACCGLGEKDLALSFVVQHCLPAETNLLAETLKEVLRQQELLASNELRVALFAQLERTVKQTLQQPNRVFDILFADNTRCLLEALADSCTHTTPEQLVPLLAHSNVVRKLWDMRALITNQCVVQPILHAQAAFTAAELRQPVPDTPANLEKLCAELHVASSQEQPVEVRLGCVKALKTLAPHDLYATLVAEQGGGQIILHPFLINLYRVTAALLNDEHDAVRENMAKVVGECPRKIAKYDASKALQLLQLPGLSHVELALEMCFSWIGDMALLSQEGLRAALDHLAAIVLHSVNPTQSAVFYDGPSLIGKMEAPQLPYAPCVVAGNTNVVFEVENHNLFAEDLHTVQLALKELQFLADAVRVSSDLQQVYDAFLVSFGSRLVTEAKAVAGVLSSLGGGETRTLAFSSVYRLKTAAKLCHSAAEEVFTLIPPHPTDSLWLSHLDDPTAVLTAEQWKELLFLVV